MRRALLSVVGVPELFKERLFEMASRGMDRPRGQSSSALERKLSSQLSQFTSEAHRNFDQRLTATLKRLRPDWFGFDASVMTIMKELLRDRALLGQPAPDASAPCPVERRLAQALADLQNPKSGRYDPAFTSEIKPLAAPKNLSKPDHGQKWAGSWGEQRPHWPDYPGRCSCLSRHCLGSSHGWRLAPPEDVLCS